MPAVSPIDATSAKRYAEILKAVGHPIRLQIIDHLTKGEKCVGELEEIMDVQQAICSQQLKILRMTGLVQADRRNGKVYYSLQELHLKELMKCIRKCGC